MSNNINKTCNNFLKRLIQVVNNIAPLKTVTIKTTSSQWFHREIVEKLSLRDNCLKNSN